MATRRWRDLTPTGRRLLGAAAATQFALLAAALIDLARRPQSQIRGPKRMWVGLSFVNFAGPAAYFAFGRRRQAAAGEGQEQPRSEEQRRHP